VSEFFQPIGSRDYNGKGQIGRRIAVAIGRWYRNSSRLRLGTWKKRSEFVDSSSPKGSRDRSSFSNHRRSNFFHQEVGSEFDLDERKKGRNKVTGGVASTS
jgi:hypothetical protein